MGESIVFVMFLIFTGAAVFATVALWLRQALIVSYILIGVLIAQLPGEGLAHGAVIQEMAEIGIIFLLFLLGLDLAPQSLLRLLRATTWLTLVSALIFAGFAAGVAALFGYRGGDLLVISIAATFSSTIIGLKLLPTTVLHHRRTGEIIISILLFQDVLAIIAMLVIQSMAGEVTTQRIALELLALPLVGTVAWLGQRWLVLPLLRRFDRIGEYVFLLAIGWGLGIAVLAEQFGLSYAMGGFIAGVALAGSPIAPYVAENLKPLRDFFLVLFFFAVGADFDPAALPDVWLAALLLGGGVLLIKPLVFRTLLLRQTSSGSALEIGVRLGQLSEFSLLLGFVALQAGVLSASASALIQCSTMLTFVISTYWIVLRYPSPVALTDELRRD